jgi:cobalt-zinc-cadmium efflux system membrane fusion protein
MAPRNKKIKRQQPAVLLAAFGLLTAMALSGCNKELKTAGPPTPTVEGNTVVFAPNAPQISSVLVEPAEPRKLAITHLTGRLLWNDEKTVRIFTPVAGRVTAIPADLGQSVSVGTPLAEIDSPDFGQALAGARTAAGNLATAEKAFIRARELFAHGAAAQQDVESAQAAHTAALAERDRAEATLANYGGSDRDTNEVYILRSPLAGVLVEKNITPGQELRADQMLANAPNLFAPHFVVSDPAKLWLQLDVAESELPSLKRGQELRICSGAYPDKTFEGQVQNIGDELNPDTRTVKVQCVVENPDRLLKAGMYVMVDVVMDLGQTAGAGVEVPAKAIFMRENQYYLFIQQSPCQYQRQQVKVGTEQDGKVPVFEGVTAGQKVVTEGSLLLQSLVEPAS